MIETIFIIFIKILAGIILIALMLTVLKLTIDMLKEKRNHGEWVRREDMDFIDQNGVEHFHYMCENCGIVHDFLDCHTEQYNFCPTCGADMRGETK